MDEILHGIEIPVTDHVILSHLRVTDFGDLIFHLNDTVISDNTLTVPYPYTRAHAEGFLQHVLDFETKEGIQKDWVIRRKGTLIGGIGVLYNFGIHAHKSEIGYWISRDFRGQGIMTSAIGALTEYLFDNTPLVRLEAHVFLGNTPSARVLEKNSFVLEGIARATYLKQGELKDTWQYARIKE